MYVLCSFLSPDILLIEIVSNFCILWFSASFIQYKVCNFIDCSIFLHSFFLWCFSITSTVYWKMRHWTLEQEHARDTRPWCHQCISIVLRSSFFEQFWLCPTLSAPRPLSLTGLQSPKNKVLAQFEQLENMRSIWNGSPIRLLFAKYINMFRWRKFG